MSNITLKQCEYFRAVALLGGIVPAAKTVGVSQPAIAQAIRKLEDITGMIMFDRLHARGMELTAQGRAFLGHAERLLTAADQMDDAVVSISENRSGTIRLGCFHSIAPFCLAQIVSGYKEKNPGIVVEVKELLQAELVTAIEQNELDLAIMYDLGLDPSVLSWHKVSSMKPYLIVPPGHRLEGADDVPIKEIATEDFILFDAPQSAEYFYSIFAQFGISPRISFRSSSIESVRCSVANGLGVSILSMRPKSASTYDGKRVVSLELQEKLQPTPVVVAYKAGSTPEDLLMPLVNYCADVFDEMT